MCGGAGETNAVTNQAAGGGDGHTGHNAALAFENEYAAATGHAGGHGAMGGTGATGSVPNNEFAALANNGSAAHHANNDNLEAYNNASLSAASEQLGNQLGVDEAAAAADALGFEQMYGISAADFAADARVNGVNGALKNLGFEFDDKYLDQGPQDGLYAELNIADAIEALSLAPIVGNDSGQVGQAAADVLGINADGLQSFRGNDRKGEQDGAANFAGQAARIAADNGFVASAPVNQAAYNAMMLSGMNSHDTSGHVQTDANGQEYELAAEAGNPLFSFTKHYLHLGGDAFVG